MYGLPSKILLELYHTKFETYLNCIFSPSFVSVFVLRFCWRGKQLGSVLQSTSIKSTAASSIDVNPSSLPFTLEASNEWRSIESAGIGSATVWATDKVLAEPWL
mmetsp:Transcript_18444/g.27868  ORF Transcript_18444/g.27868 Transcript_18444/m.27868 type:complete len:104 (+) Transcript_18444:98-409(+)